MALARPAAVWLLLLRQAAAGCVEDRTRDGTCSENYRDCTCASANAATDSWERQDWKQGEPCIPDYMNPEAATPDAYGSLSCAGNTSIPGCPSLGAAADDAIQVNCAPEPQPDTCPGEAGGWDLEDCTFPVGESDGGGSSCNPDPALYWGLLAALVIGLVVLVGGLAHNTMRNKQQANFAENGKAVDGRCIKKEERQTTTNSNIQTDGHNMNENRVQTSYFVTYTYVLPQNEGQYWQVIKEAKVSKEHYDEMSEGGVVTVLYLKDDALLSNPKRAILQVQTTYADGGVPMFAFVG